MNKLGDITRGHQLGYRHNAKYIWIECAVCKKPKWVEFKNGEPISSVCRGCLNKRETDKRYGKANANWRGGRSIRAGYVYVKIHPSDFFFSMATKYNYISEHRLVMAQYLGRCLLPWEIVHHKNNDRLDNRLENLELLPHPRFHLVDSVTKSYIAKLEAQIKQLQEQLKTCVQIDPNAELPLVYCKLNPISRADEQQDMLKAGWRKTA